MHPSPALVPRLSALARASVKPAAVRHAVEHAETHAPIAPLFASTTTSSAHAPLAASASHQYRHHLHPHPLQPLAHATHPFRTPRKYLFFTTVRRTEPLPAPMVEWNDHLSMV